MDEVEGPPHGTACWSDAPIYVMEHHDAAYWRWRDGGHQGAAVVHVDAHHDLTWLAPGGMLTIGNYLCRAIAERIAEEVYWVVPDASVAGARGRRVVEDQVRVLTRAYAKGRIEGWVGSALRADLDGCALWVGALADLPRIARPVLLDLDTDFLIYASIEDAQAGLVNDLPWRWPGDLVAQLCHQNWLVRCVTIAYSVEGAFTPIHWKYLGDELASRLSAAPDSKDLVVYDACRHAAMRLAAGARADAAAVWRDAATGPGGAAAAFALAHLLAADGDLDEGRRWYDVARRADGAYRSPHAYPGLHALRARVPRVAARGLERARQLDPADAVATFWLAEIASDSRAWAQAEPLAAAVLASRGDAIDAMRIVARVKLAGGDVRAAIDLIERSLKLALHGARPMGHVLLQARPGILPLLDGDHARAYATLAVLYARIGDRAKALSCARIAKAAGEETPLLRWRLGWWFLRSGERRNACSEFAHAIQMQSEALRRDLRAWRRRRRARRVVADFFDRTPFAANTRRSVETHG